MSSIINSPAPNLTSQRARKAVSRIKILAIILIVIVGVGGLVGYSYTQITTNVSDVEYSGITTREPGVSTLLSMASGDTIGTVLSLLESLVLQANIDIGNGGFLPIIVPPIDYVFSINGLPVGSGSSDSSYTINPGDLIKIPVSVEISVSDLRPLMESIATSLGELDVEINGKIKPNILGLPIEISIDKKKHISLGNYAKEKASAWLSRVGCGEGNIPFDFSIESMKWIVNGREVITADPGSTVTALVVIKAEKRFGYDVALEVRQDRQHLLDVSFETQTYSIVMQPGETKELSATFRVDDGITVKGYFMSLRWSGHQWQMPCDYPPRLSVDEVVQGNLEIDAFWTLGGSRVTSVEDNALVTANIDIRADGDFDGLVTVEVRQDRNLAVDVSVISMSFNVQLSSGEEGSLIVPFVAQSGEEGYFTKVSWNGGSKDMSNSYPPRLIVEENALPLTSNNLQIVDAFWTTNINNISNVRINQASDKMIVVAHILVKAEGDLFTGEVTFDVRQDNTASPDSTAQSSVQYISLSDGEEIELILVFTVEDHWYSKGYFMELSWDEGTWTMVSEYPPRLTI